jgi:hypothetical protein
LHHAVLRDDHRSTIELLLDTVPTLLSPQSRNGHGDRRARTSRPARIIRAPRHPSVRGVDRLIAAC